MRGFREVLFLVLRDSSLDLRVRDGENAIYGILEPLPGFRAFDVFRRLHSSIIAQSSSRLE